MLTLAATAALVGGFALAVPATGGAQGLDLGQTCEDLGFGSQPTTIHLEPLAVVTVTTCKDVTVPRCTFTQKTITVTPLVRLVIRYCQL